MQTTTLSPAKINLFLHVTGKRADGYHELHSLMCCVGLYDTLTISFNQKRHWIVCNHPNVPADDTNLAIQAAEAFYKETDMTGGAGIVLEKIIPPGSGLGGGSSNAASVLKTLNRQHNHPLSAARLCEIGAKLGADIPFFIEGKPALASGIGDVLMPYSGLPRLVAVIVYPGFSVSTAWVYKNLNLALTNCKNTLNYRPLRDWEFSINHHLCNDLETVTEQKFPEISEVKKELRTQGAEGVLMSGSGSAVFGLFSDPDAAQTAFGALSCHENWRVYIAETIV